MRDMSQNLIFELWPDSFCSDSDDILPALFVVQTPLFPSEIQLFPIEFWSFQRTLSPLDPCRLIAHDNRFQFSFM